MSATKYYEQITRILERIHTTQAAKLLEAG
jgi:hypothetical protein